MKTKVIAIDGPAGAGKSTIAKLVAEKLGYIYIDTGAMYRAITLAYLRTNQEFSAELVSKLAHESKISFKVEQGQNRVLLNNEDVSEEIRTSLVSKNVSQVAAVAQVRTALVEQQRQLGSEHSAVLDGRDIGTVVFPQAECKIFLTASVAERAKRRYLELINKGVPAELATIEQDIAARDKQDMERAVSPLRQAEDAILVDTSTMDIPTVAQRILEIVG